jgi:hypothetical protein
VNYNAVFLALNVGQIFATILLAVACFIYFGRTKDKLLLIAGLGFVLNFSGAMHATYIEHFAPHVATNLENLFDMSNKEITFSYMLSVIGLGVAGVSWVLFSIKKAI